MHSLTQHFDHVQRQKSVTQWKAAGGANVSKRCLQFFFFFNQVVSVEAQVQVKVKVQQHFTSAVQYRVSKKNNKLFIGDRTIIIIIIIIIKILDAAQRMKGFMH